MHTTTTTTGASLQRIKYDMMESGNRWRLNANKKTDAVGSVVSHAWMTVDYQSKQYSDKQILQSESQEDQDRSTSIQCTKIWIKLVRFRKKYNSFFSKTDCWCRSMAQRVLHTYVSGQITKNDEFFTHHGKHQSYAG